MTYTFDYGFTRGDAKNLSIFDQDHSVWAKSGESILNKGKTMRATYVNTTSPSDRVQTLMLTCNLVDNVYKGTGINPDAQAPFSQGVQIKASVRSVYKVTDTNGKEVYLPVESQVQYTVPLHEAMTNDEINKCLKDVISECYPEGSVTSDLIGKWTKRVLEA